MEYYVHARKEKFMCTNQAKRINSGSQTLARYIAILLHVNRTRDLAKIAARRRLLEIYSYFASEFRS